MHIKLNGKAHELPASITVAELAQQLGLAPKQVAVEHNRQIVPRAQYNAVALQEGDEVEIVHFIGGG